MCRALFYALETLWGTRHTAGPDLMVLPWAYAAQSQHKAQSRPFTKCLPAECMDPPGTCKLEHPGNSSMWSDVPHPGSAPSLNGVPSLALLTDVVDGASAELSIELLGSEAPQVMDGKRPEVQHIVPGEGVPLLHHNHFGPQVGKFNGSAQTTWSSPNDETLQRPERRETFSDL